MLTLSPEELTAVRLSLRVALWAVAASLPVGIAVAVLLARARFWGKTALEGLVYLPLVLPPVVTGYVLLLVFGRRGFFGAFLAETFGRHDSVDEPHLIGLFCGDFITGE